jgi:ribonuclease D
VQYETITNSAQLSDLCQRLSSAKVIAFDTEFVSEHTYSSQLCLVQVSSEDVLAVIDTMEFSELEPFWTMLAEGDHQTVVHAGREELLFSLRSIGRRPANLFDVQIAAGLVGLEYPAGYGSLVYKLTGQHPPKGETRTDWRKRPLSEQQIEYALSDVTHLRKIYTKLVDQLAQLDRQSWIQEEMAAWQDDVEGYLTRPRWRKVSGITSLSRKSLSIVRELWLWREGEAAKRDRPPKRILRDDLIVEMAKRATADPERMLAIRGMDRGNYKQYVLEMAKSVQRGLDAPEESAPRKKRADTPGQLNLLGQFLTAALTSICRRGQVAPSLVGTATDVRELIAHRLGFGNNDQDNLPALSQGWRATVVGNHLDDLLSGKTSMRIANPLSDEPLEFEPRA